MLGYNEIVELEREGGWTSVWDNEQKNPYIYKGNQWIGYENPKSIAIKVEYAKSLNLGAVMIWSIETEDFRGVSGSKYPILKTINQTLGGVSNKNLAPESAPEPEKEAESHEPESDSKSSSDSSSVCTRTGYVRDPVDCSQFYYCLLNNGVYIPLAQKCNAGLVFDEKNLRCDYPEAVQC